MILTVSARLKRSAFALDAAFSGSELLIGLFGPSGSGKTTILNLIAGLERPAEGHIALNGRILVDTAQGVYVPAHKRRVGMVFQDGQLFPHMTVEQNLRFASSFSATDEDHLPEATIVETLGIGHLMHRRPLKLSGGEKQRVALARALFARPEILLMDEPLASLDDARKEEILVLIERLRDEFRVPMLYVSHAAGEIKRLASRVVVLDHGRVVADGTPAGVL